MALSREKQELFYCRKGMKRWGPFNRGQLRQFLSAGLLDAHSLVSVGDSNVMLPLGASKAAKEITWVARHWYWQHTIVLYWAWLIFTPLFSAGLAGFSICHSRDVFILIPAAIAAGNLGMSLWLYQKWRILLAEDKHMPWKAALYALPMAIPVVNCVWLWIGYMRLPKYWRRFKAMHKIPDQTPYLLYYLVMAVFYLMIVSEILYFFVQRTDGVLTIQIVGLISWLWYGLTLMSLFFTDQITLLLIKDKLSNLAYGALSCCADINYDTLHQAVLGLARRARRGIFVTGGILLLISWLAGGWFWMYALEIWQMEQDGTSRLLVEHCPFCTGD